MTEKLNTFPEKGFLREYFLETFFTSEEVLKMEERGWINKYNKLKIEKQFLTDTNTTKINKEQNTAKSSIKYLFQEINPITEKKEKPDNIKGKYIGKIDKNHGIIKLLERKSIIYFNIKKKLSYVDMSGFNKDYSPNNIQSGSELFLEEKNGKYVIKIIPPLLVQSKKFEKEKIPETGELIVAIINNECQKYGIIPELYISLIGVESSFGTNLRSQTGYIGYSMLRKDTSIAELLRLGKITKNDAKKAMSNNGKTKENIIAGIKYFSLLYNKFDGYKDKIKLTLAAYNGGPTKIQNIANNLGLPKSEITFTHIVNSGRLSNETKKYPGKILAIVKNFYNKTIV